MSAKINTINTITGGVLADAYSARAHARRLARRIKSRASEAAALEWALKQTENVRREAISCLCQMH